MRFIYPALLLLTAFSTAGGNSWSKTIGQDEGWIHSLRDVLELSNGSLVISIAGPFEDPFLICFDPEGNVLWYRHVLERGGTSRAFESCGNLLALEDGFAAYYHSEPRATGFNTDVAVVRFGNSGEILWTYILGENSNSNWLCTDMISCSDKGFLITGCPGRMFTEGFALKLSPDGVPEWMTPSDEIAAYALSAVETPDGDFMILVHECPGSIALQRVSEEGTVFPPLPLSDTDSFFNSIIRLLNGSAWIFSSVEGTSFLASRLDSSFKIDRIVEFELSPESRGVLSDITEQGFLVAGRTEEGNALLSMFDFDGSLLWQRVYDTGGEESLTGALCLNDGILALGGIGNSNGYNTDLWILKTDSIGFIEGALTTDSDVQRIDPCYTEIELHAPGWVMACAVTEEKENARNASVELMESSGLRAGYLWIPDWQSLSGAEGWLVYAETSMEGSGSLEEGVETLRQTYPDAYFVWVSHGWDRDTMSLDEFFSEF